MQMARNKWPRATLDRDCWCTALPSQPTLHSHPTQQQPTLTSDATERKKRAGQAQRPTWPAGGWSRERYLGFPLPSGLARARRVQRALAVRHSAVVLVIVIVVLVVILVILPLCSQLSMCPGLGDAPMMLEALLACRQLAALLAARGQTRAPTYHPRPDHRLVP